MIYYKFDGNRFVIGMDDKPYYVFYANEKRIYEVPQLVRDYNALNPYSSSKESLDYMRKLFYGNSHNKD